LEGTAVEAYFSRYNKQQQLRLTSAGTISNKNKYLHHTKQAHYLFSFGKEKKNLLPLTGM